MKVLYSPHCQSSPVIIALYSLYFIPTRERDRKRERDREREKERERERERDRDR